MFLKSKKQRNAFTLFEILAVIVVIAIIATITIPTVRNIMGVAKRDTFSLAAHKVLDAVYEEGLIDKDFEPSQVNINNLKEKLNIYNPNYKTISISRIASNEYYVEIEGQGKWKNLVACGVYNAISVGDGSNCNGDVPHIPGGDQPGGNDPGIPPFDGTVNPPALAKGMTPIKWVENGNGVLEVVQTDVNDSDWYDYGTTEGTRRWANAQTEDGSFWVWIPRYAYSITMNYHKDEIGIIMIKFLKDTSNIATDNSEVAIVPEYLESTQLNYIKHPAFTFGDKELTGFWMAKFEMSGVLTDLSVIPGVESLRYKSIGEMFIASRQMETNLKYGWNRATGYQAEGFFITDNNGVDVHMLKNTEWGAVAYLTQSEYGKNALININDSYFITGATNKSEDYRDNCDCSTTGNIYGIYDIGGGAYEYVAAYLVDGDDNYLAHGSSIIKADNKYKNIYKGYYAPFDVEAGDYNIYGDAVWETSGSVSCGYSWKSWYGEYSCAPSNYDPWFIRGGSYDAGSLGGIFCFYKHGGSADNYRGWRVAVAVGEGL